MLTRRVGESLPPMVQVPAFSPAVKGYVVPAPTTSASRQPHKSAHLSISNRKRSDEACNWPSQADLLAAVAPHAHVLHKASTWRAPRGRCR